MRKILKWIGIVVGAVIGLLIVAAVVLYAVGASRLGKHYTVSEAFTAPTSAQAVARGKYLVSSTAGCFGCHGPGGANGPVFFSGPPFGTLAAPNLTAGKGGIGGQMTDADWNRAIRHGIGHDGRLLVIMPSTDFSHLSDEDLGGIVAYLKTLTPIDYQAPPRNLLFVADIGLGAGLFGQLAAESIDHNAAHAASVPPAETAEYGQYIASLATCSGCHGPKLDGKGGGGPSSVVPPNLTPSGEVGTWTKAQFINTIRMGVTPSGHQLTDDMPWKQYKNMTDQDLGALYLYLHSLPASQ
jgi:mono/diheme cytochrome c family protein